MFVFVMCNRVNADAQVCEGKRVTARGVHVPGRLASVGELLSRVAKAGVSRLTLLSNSIERRSLLFFVRNILECKNVGVFPI